MVLFISFMVHCLFKIRLAVWFCMYTALFVIHYMQYDIYIYIYIYDMVILEAVYRLSWSESQVCGRLMSHKSG